MRAVNQALKSERSLIYVAMLNPSVLLLQITKNECIIGVLSESQLLFTLLTSLVSISVSFNQDSLLPNNLLNLLLLIHKQRSASPPITRFKTKNKHENCLHVGRHCFHFSLPFLFISPLFNQVGQLRTSSHLQLWPVQDEAKQCDTNNRVTHGINKHTVYNTVEKVYIQCVQMRQDKGGKAINRPWCEVITIQKLNTGMVDVQKIKVQGDITGVQRSQINK